MTESGGAARHNLLLTKSSDRVFKNKHQAVSQGVR